MMNGKSAYQTYLKDNHFKVYISFPVILVFCAPTEQYSLGETMT